MCLSLRVPSREPHGRIATKNHRLRSNQSDGDVSPPLPKENVHPLHQNRTRSTPPLSPGGRLPRGLRHHWDLTTVAHGWRTGALQKASVGQKAVS